MVGIVMNYNLGLLGKNSWLHGNEIAIIYSISYCSRSMRGQESAEALCLMACRCLNNSTVLTILLYLYLQITNLQYCKPPPYPPPSPAHPGVHSQSGASKCVKNIVFYRYFENCPSPFPHQSKISLKSH